MSEKEKDLTVDLDSPSPALGKAIATVVHQAVTDPYFRPLEKLAKYLGDNPDCDMITVEQMTKWAPDDEFPACFVWDADGSRMAVDNAASPWAMEKVVDQIRIGLQKENPRGLLYIGTFEAEGEKYWMGYLKVPLHASEPTQVAGAFFSIDRYLNEDVPRLIDEVVERRRFPLVDFQLTDLPTRGEKDGSISFRILNKKDEIYFQRGRNFEEKQMIYSESQWYPNPIVCLQEGWDLQVFSTNAQAREVEEGKMKISWIIVVITFTLITILYWWGVSNRKQDKIRSTEES